MQRLNQAFRPGTQRRIAYVEDCFRGFVNHYNINVQCIQDHDILAYLEFLCIKGWKYNTIVSHMSLLKNVFFKLQLPAELLASRSVKLMLRSCSLTLDFKPTVRGIFTLPDLANIIQSCNTLNDPKMYKFLFLLSFFGFLRISNCVPRSSRNFDPRRHLARGDILVAPPGLQIVIKWSKTMQSSTNVKTIPICTIPGSILCPVAAFKNYTLDHPAPQNHPLFLIRGRTQNPVSASESTVRTALATILHALCIDPHTHGFHAFRRSGATLAYHLGVPLPDIQQHGTWLSDAVWAYLLPHSDSTPVTTAFTTHIQGRW